MLHSAESKPSSHYLNLTVKLVFTAIALYILLSKIELHETLHYMKDMHIGYVIIALLLLNIGQVVSGLRTRYYFVSHGLPFPPRFVIALYYVGMFFNRILPGGIGGDAYITYRLKRKYNISMLTTVRVLLSSRSSGLFLLGLITCALLPFSQHIHITDFSNNVLALAGVILLIPSYLISVRALLRERAKTSLGAIPYSFIVQLAVLFSALLLFLAVNPLPNLVDYLIIFMISSIMTLLPISFGGLGMRELTYLYLGGWFHLDIELGIAISVIYFALDTFSSLAGLVFLAKLDKLRN